MKRRAFVATLAGSVIAGLAGCRLARREARFDAVVTRTPERAGVPAFDTVASAIAAAPSQGRVPFRILVTRGRWHERLVIDKPHIHLVGEDRNASILTHDTAAGQLDPTGKPWGTWGCASVIVRAPDFSARHLTIENAFDYVGNLLQPKLEAIGSNGPQAVALMLAEGADRSLLDDVELIGHQDTLFADAGRSLFRGCRVQGSVDFVFGAGQAVFTRCELRSRYRPGKPRQGYVAVPSTSARREHGLTFERCRLTREPEVPDRSVVLGRAWRPTRDFPDGRYGDPDAVGSAVYLECWMEAHIAPEGWDEMNYAARDGTRVPLRPSEARLFEYRSSGPGAQADPRRRTLNETEAARHAPRAVLGDWIP